MVVHPRVSLASPIHRWKAVVGVAWVAVCLLTSVAAVRAPLLSVVLAAAVTVAAMLVARLDLAVAVLAASFYFDGYLSHGAGLLTLGKAVGGLAVVAWAVAWALGRRPLVGDASLWLICGLAVLMLPSIAGALDSSQALIVASRYYMFFALYFLVLQAVGDERRYVGVIVDATLAAATVAAAIGLFGFLNGTVRRASGPLTDANDFAFLLASALPLAVYRIRWAATPRRRGAAAIAALVIAVTIAVTFSRTAGVALATAILWALVFRRLRLRWIALMLVCFVATGLTVYLTEPEIVRTALEQKRNVAATNVSSRLRFYDVAISEFKSAPVFGVGPGNYQVRYPEFDPFLDVGRGAFTTHNAYLNVLADLGLPSLILFASFIGVSWWRLRKRFPDEPERGDCQAAIAAGFLVAIVGSLFLTEQFYSPLWLLAALGIANARENGRPQTMAGDGAKAARA